METLRVAACSLSLCASLLASRLHAQQPLPGDPASPPATDSVSLSPPNQPSPIVRDVDLLRRDGFSRAGAATITLRVFDRGGRPLRDLKAGEFTLTVNGAERPGRLQGPNDPVAPPVPLVLLVFPPNQPIIHHIGIRDARQYFAGQPLEHLPWKVAIFDSDGSATSFTDGRSQLLAYLEVLEHKTEPLQYTTEIGIAHSSRSQGSWLTQAEHAISAMQPFDGPKVILAFNPVAEGMYGLNTGVFAYDGPEALVNIAQSVGAHIYIANLGGPGTLVPGGDASSLRPPPRINPITALPVPGSASSAALLAASQQAATLNYFAYRSSLMMQTAHDTFGGFSNSLKELAAQIHQDLDENYALTFDLHPEDRDRGVPTVAVRLADHTERVALLDIKPITTPAEASRRAVSKEAMAAMWKRSSHPVSSSDFEISQHIDYFPVRGGLQPVLPMSCTVQWRGAGPAPARISVAEYVENTTLSSRMLEHELEVSWSGRAVSWERDGYLYPGRYTWRVVLHDETGKILASAEERVSVDIPRDTTIALSSIVLGKSCRSQGAASSGLRKRSELSATDQDQLTPVLDPMRAADCRLRPEPTDQYATTDALHAFLRVYPDQKLEKHPPEQWRALFSLHSATGAVELERELPFTVDAGSGYLASIELPLNSPAIQPGAHIVSVRVRGPGIRKELVEARPLTINRSP